MDVELESHREAVVKQPRGDEDAFRVARFHIAMARCLVADCGVEAFRDHRVVAFAQRQRNEVKRFAIESRGDGARDRLDHALQVRGGQRDFAQRGVTDAVGRLCDAYVADDLLRVSQRCVGCLGHGIILA